MCEIIFTFVFNLAVIENNIDFSRNCPKFHLFTKMVIFESILEFFFFLDQLLLPYKFHGSSMTGTLLFNFASCEWLNSNFNTQAWCSYRRVYFESTISEFEHRSVIVHCNVSFGKTQLRHSKELWKRICVKGRVPFS